MPPVLQPVQANIPTTAPERALQQNRVLRNTYLLLAVTLIPTAVGAVIGTNLNMSFLRSSPIISFFAILAIFYGWIWAIERNRDSGVGVALLLGFTLFLGLLLGPLFQQVLGLKNGAQLVMLAAGGTAAVFFALSAVARTTDPRLQRARQVPAGRRDRDHARGRRERVLREPRAVPGHPRSVRPVLVAHHPLADQLDRPGRRDELRLATLTLYVAIYNLFSSLLQLLGIFGGDRD